MALLLGIDLGTSYFKVGLFDAGGALRGLGRVAVGKHPDAAGRNELAVGEFWRLLQQGLTDALAQANARADDIIALSYSSQANTFVLLDRENEPLTPFVIWNDRRAFPVEPAVMRFGETKEFPTATGFAGLAAEFAAVKWRWFQRNEPAVWARTARALTLPEYFAFVLTGEATGDTSTAAFTGLFSTGESRWWPAALDFFGVTPAMLATPRRPGTRCGQTGGRARDLLGLPAGVPFAAGGLDHYMAAIGSGLGRLGDASISTGTVLAALQLVDHIETVADCFHGPCHDDGFYRLAFDPAGAGQLEDYQQKSAPHLSIEQLAALAAGAHDGPRGDAPEARHGVAVRKLMEQISATHRRLLRQVQGGQPIRKVIATGGGARSNAWLQINADMLEVTVIAPRCHERACLGAAAFAAVAAGMQRSLAEALAAMVHSDRIFEPRPDAVAFYREQRARGVLRA
jgi:xylulokinase